MKDNESLLKGLICLNSAYRVKTHTNTDTCIILHYCKKKKKKIKSLTSTEQWDKATATNSSPAQKSQYWIVLWWLTMTCVNKSLVLTSKSCEHIIAILSTQMKLLHYKQFIYSAAYNFKSKMYFSQSMFVTHIFLLNTHLKPCNLCLKHLGGL